MDNKVLRHPDKEEIIKRLLNGDSLKEVERWLKKKHPRTKRLQISYMTIQKFRSEHLMLKGQVLEDIKNKRGDENREASGIEARRIIASSSAYEQKIQEIADSNIDVTRRLLEMDKLINSRIEYYFNLLQEGGNVKHDKVFLEYIGTMKGIMQDWKKYIEGVADTKIEHNINLNVINDQVGAVKEAVCEILEEIDPSLISVFVEKVSRKMDMLEPSSVPGMSSRYGSRRIIDVTPYE